MTPQTSRRIQVTRRVFAKGASPTDRYNRALKEYAKPDFLLKSLYSTAGSYADAVLRNETH